MPDVNSPPPRLRQHRRRSCAGGAPHAGRCVNLCKHVRVNPRVHYARDRTGALGRRRGSVLSVYGVRAVYRQRRPSCGRRREASVLAPTGPALGEAVRCGCGRAQLAEALSTAQLAVTGMKHHCTRVIPEVKHIAPETTISISPCVRSRPVCGAALCRERSRAVCGAALCQTSSPSARVGTCVLPRAWPSPYSLCPPAARASTLGARPAPHGVAQAHLP